jgi:hypothetical protein
MPPLELQSPPFRSDSPPWYNNGVWGTLGCAVPQTGKYLHTTNIPIWELVDVAGRQLFHLLWHYDDRKFESPPSKNCLWEVYSLILIARKRIADRTYGPEETVPLATHAKPAPQMFRLYPVPFYGRLGCVNSFLYEATQNCLLLLTEAMEHADNERSGYTTLSFAQALTPYLQGILTTLATKFFNYPRKDTLDPAFVIPEDKWKTYNPLAWSVSVEGTSTRPPVGWTPTEQDLEPIRGLPASDVIPFLQPWPEASLWYSPGGVWSPNQAAGQKAQEGTAGPTGAFASPPGPP